MSWRSLKASSKQKALKIWNACSCLCKLIPHNYAFPSFKYENFSCKYFWAVIHFARRFLPQFKNGKKISWWWSTWVALGPLKSVNCFKIMSQLVSFWRLNNDNLWLVNLMSLKWTQRGWTSYRLLRLYLIRLFLKCQLEAVGCNYKM